MSENVFRIVVVILLSVITLLLLFGLGEGQSCNGVQNGNAVTSTCTRT